MPLVTESLEALIKTNEIRIIGTRQIWVETAHKDTAPVVAHAEWPQRADGFHDQFSRPHGASGRHA